MTTCHIVSQSIVTLVTKYVALTQQFIDNSVDKLTTVELPESLARGYWHDTKLSVLPSKDRTLNDFGERAGERWTGEWRWGPIH